MQLKQRGRRDGLLPISLASGLREEYAGIEYGGLPVLLFSLLCCTTTYFVLA